jgi:hypothetical protein
VCTRRCKQTPTYPMVWTHVVKHGPLLFLLLLLLLLTSCFLQARQQVAHRCSVTWLYRGSLLVRRWVYSLARSPRW